MADRAGLLDTAALGADAGAGDSGRGEAGLAGPSDPGLAASSVGGLESAAEVAAADVERLSVL